MTAQSNKARKGRIGAVAAATTLAIAFIGDWEGYSSKAYRDIVGVPTICWGETKGVKMGDVMTKGECSELFQRRLAQFEGEVLGCTPALADHPVKRLVAFVSHAYNVGTGAYCGSTLARKFNAGDIKGACNELPKWSKAGGKVVFGLVRRRAAERTMCLEGL